MNPFCDKSCARGSSCTGGIHFRDANKGVDVYFEKCVEAVHLWNCAPDCSWEPGPELDPRFGHANIGNIFIKTWWMLLRVPPGFREEIKTKLQKHVPRRSEIRNYEQSGIWIEFPKNIFNEIEQTYKEYVKYAFGRRFNCEKNKDLVVLGIDKIKQLAAGKDKLVQNWAQSHIDGLEDHIKKSFYS